MAFSVLLSSNPATVAQEKVVVERVDKRGGDHQLTRVIGEAIDQKNWKKAIEVYSKSQQKIADTPDQQLYYLAVAHLESARSVNARPFLEEHQRRYPDAEVTAELLSRVAVRRRDKALLDKCLHRFPQNAQILVSASNWALNLAIREKEKELPVDHKDYWSMINKPPGRSDAKKYFDLAERYIVSALTLHPDNYEAHIAAATLKSHLNRFDESIEHLLDANDVSPLPQEKYMLLAKYYRNEARYEEALQAIEMAIKVRPVMFTEFVMLRAEIYRKLEKHDKAAEDLLAVLRRNHNHPTVRKLLGDAALAAENYPLAIFAFRESYVCDSNLYSLAKIGRCAVEMGLNDTAIHYVDRAIRESEEKIKSKIRIPSDWLFTRGQAYWENGRKLDAADDLLAAARKDPGNPQKIRWATYVFTELKSPNGLVEVARLWGRHGNAREAINMLRTINETWKFPVSVDHRGRRVVGHNRANLYAVAQILDLQNQPRMAFNAWMGAYFDWSVWSSWLAVRAGDLRAAARGFRSLQRNRKETDKQHGYVGMAFYEISRGNAKDAEAHIEKILLPGFVSIKPTLQMYADALKDPQTVKEFSWFDALGIVGFHFKKTNTGTGLQVSAILPGSVLQNTHPQVRLNDVILEINGVSLDAADRVEHFRKMKESQDEIVLTVARGKATFQVRLNLDSARASIQQQLEILGKTN